MTDSYSLKCLQILEDKLNTYPERFKDSISKHKLLPGETRAYATNTQTYCIKLHAGSVMLWEKSETRKVILPASTYDVWFSMVEIENEVFQDA